MMIIIRKCRLPEVINSYLEKTLAATHFSLKVANIIVAIKSFDTKRNK